MTWPALWHKCGTTAATSTAKDSSRGGGLGCDLQVLAGAGDRDRTGMTSLEGWGSTIELRPRRSDHRP